MLTNKGKEILVDDIDYDKYHSCFWSLNSCGYVGSSLGFLHHLILGKKRGLVVDHINNNKLDNRRENLRHVSSSFNNGRTKGKGASSGYKGVSYYKRNRKYQVQIRTNGKQIALGYYHSKEEAARVYDEAAIKYYGKDTHLNFPAKQEKEIH